MAIFGHEHWRTGHDVAMYGIDLHLLYSELMLAASVSV
jgi:hypothetical protein